MSQRSDIKIKLQHQDNATSLNNFKSTVAQWPIAKHKGTQNITYQF